MSKKILTFGDTEIEKNKFYWQSPTFLEDVDIEKVLVSNKISSSKKTIIIIKLSHYI